MGRNILYYPTFRPPSALWLRNALLYWDSVSTIVPMEDGDQIKDPDLTFLRGEGAYRPVAPLALYEAATGDTWLEERFSKEIAEPAFTKRLAESPVDDYVRLSAFKLFPSIQRILEEREWLAWDWREGSIPVKKPIADLYMSLLARFVADNCSGDYSQPCTSDPGCEALAFGGGFDPGVHVLLDRALPQARPDATLADILLFRKRRRDDLLRFRALMDDLQAKVADVKSEGELNFVTERFKEQVELQLVDLNTLMSEAGIKGMIGSLRALCGLKTPEVLGALGTVAATKLVAGDQAAEIVGGVALIGGGALTLASSVIDARTKRREALMSPLSYVLAGQNEGLLSK